MHQLDLGRTTGEKAVELTKNEAYGHTDSSERPRAGEGEQMENGHSDSSERPRAGEGEQMENGHSELKFQ